MAKSKIRVPLRILAAHHRSIHSDLTDLADLDKFTMSGGGATDERNDNLWPAFRLTKQNKSYIRTRRNPRAEMIYISSNVLTEPEIESVLMNYRT